MTDETKPQDSAAMSPACAGAALWALEWKEDAGRLDPEWVYATREEATEVNETGCYGRATVVPLYRSPTLTDEEREALAYFSTFCDENVVPEIWIQHAASLRGLAQRTK